MLIGLLIMTSSYPSKQKVCKPHKAGHEILWIDATSKIFHPHILALFHYDENYSLPTYILKIYLYFLSL